MKLSASHEQTMTSFLLL